MKNITSIIASLVIIFTIIIILVSNLVLSIFVVVPSFLFFVTQALKDFTNLNDTSTKEHYTFIYNILANDYILVSDDTIEQYKNNSMFVIPE